MTVLLSLFGVPSISLDGAVHPLPFERRTQLLAHLALKRSWVARDELAALLWPEQDTKLAQTNLRKALFRLQGLPGADRLDVQGRALRLELPTDVQAFEQALREERIADALALRRGELLAGFDDTANEAWTEWLGFERERLRTAWRGAVQQHLQGELPAAQAVELAQRLLDDDPLDESAVRLTMDWLVRAGQGAKARQAGREFVARLRDELGIEPSAELRALNDALAAAPAKPAPRPAAPEAAAVHAFIGRTVELRRIAALLAQDDCRLLCLTGPGGVGKTSLARQALQACAARFADGATFVELEELTSAQEIGARLAHELDVPLKGRADPLQQVIEALRARHLLLVLDNFEHLADGARQLEPLLAQCPRVKLLVTSRVRLALPQEWLLPLEGLPCPEDEDREHIESFDAARLFVRAARRVQPDLDPAAEAAAIVEICRQVDGLPLALELAASWTRVLSCAAIADELRQGSELLHTADAAQPERHASMQVVFDQSWRLLSEAERGVLARLSVFDGSFSTEAARAVAGAPLPVLAALIDKSLVGKGQQRLHLHPLVRHLAAARLTESGERHAAASAHARYFNGLLHQLRRKVEIGDRDALDAVEAEFDNCRTAWRWAAEHGPAEAQSKSVHALVHFCDHRSRTAEALALLREALAVPAVSGDALTAALLLGKAAHLEYRLDRYAEAIDTATLGLARLETAARTDADIHAQCLKVLGTCHLRLGRAHEAQRYFEKSLELTPDCADPDHRSTTLSGLALVRKMQGAYDDARRLSIEAMQEQRRLGDIAGEALSLNNLAALHLEQHELEAAAQYLRPALALCDRIGLATTRSHVLANLAAVELKLGRTDDAESYGRRALAQAEELGNRTMVSFVRYQFVRLALQRADLAAARAELQAAMTIALDLRRPALVIEGFICLALVLGAQGATDCAHAIVRFVHEHPDTSPMERDELAHIVEQLPSPPPAVLAWPAISLDELAHRTVLEAPVAFAPLIATLRAAR
jgi:predicted ATPase/DNA-binding SARP family transcriptional activator/Tfp pilus assembly protein PilF